LWWGLELRGDGLKTSGGGNMGIAWFGVIILMAIIWIVLDV
jgi:hypothetical protein